MFKRYKVLTKGYMQKYKAKSDKKVPRLEKKIRKCLIGKINKEIKICIKYGKKEILFKLSKYNVLNDSLASKTNGECYKRILLEVISEYERNGIKVSEHPYSPYKGDYIFDLEGVFDNDN
ncbi:hypothetical protein [Enterococcus cecorum]|uniref:hypothetical protein n=1 Tax=Enterococcus cecorum TaxID=44008 RepID=UPI00148B4755|nr:hypothetical protein [Enterococcus cecorum]